MIDEFTKFLLGLIALLLGAIVTLIAGFWRYFTGKNEERLRGIEAMQRSHNGTLTWVKTNVVMIKRHLGIAGQKERKQDARNKKQKT